MTQGQSICEIETNRGLQAAEIAGQNDVFRRAINDTGARIEMVRKGIQGQIVLTRGIADAGEDFQRCAIAAVVEFDTFTEDNDPHGDHSFGAVTVAGERVFWKVDLYDLAYRYGSERPHDPSVTARVLTIMLASEY